MPLDKEEGRTGRRIELIAVWNTEIESCIKCISE